DARRESARRPAERVRRAAGRARAPAKAYAEAPRCETCRARSPLQERAALRFDRATRRTSRARLASRAPPPLRATAPRVRPSPRPRSDTATLASAPCLPAMLRRMPTARSATTRLEPPYEMN